jgi:hypothetical protein
MKKAERNNPSIVASATERPAYDRSFLQTRREAWSAVLIWFLALCWVVPVSYVFGYQQPTSSAELSMTLGMPTWVFWGVAMAWVVSSIAGISLCVWFIEEEEFVETASSET